jgi:predicted AAA+ superfamily ATPase
MVDHIDGLKVILTGSSAFDIGNVTGEPLTGRKTTYHLYAFSEEELNQIENVVEKRGNLRNRLVFGNYPELTQQAGNEEKAEYLRELINSYLLKDISTFENLRNSDKIVALLRLIAYQVGSEVSLQELGKQLSMSKNTVEKYLDLLSKVFIIHKVGGFSRNLRKEVTRKSKWYFYDNGLRNMLIANLNPLESRNDVGLLWENYLISERIKYQSYTRMIVHNYFWRTYDQQEVDWVEERGGALYGYEIKWNPRKKVKIPTAWATEYPSANFEVITPENYLNWIVR